MTLASLSSWLKDLLGPVTRVQKKKKKTPWLEISRGSLRSRETLLESEDLRLVLHLERPHGS